MNVISNNGNSFVGTNRKYKVIFVSVLGATYLKDFHIFSIYFTAASIQSSTDLCRRASARASGAVLGSFHVAAKSSPLRMFAHKRSETQTYKQKTDKKRDGEKCDSMLNVYCCKDTYPNIAKGTTDPGVDCFDQYFGLVGLVQYA